MHSPLLATAAPGVAIFAEVESVSGNPILDLFLQFGVLGILFIASALGFVYFRPSVADMKEDKQVLQDANAKLVEALNTTTATLETTDKNIRALIVTVDALRSEVASMRIDQAEDRGARDH
jgi:hypothetical protein